MRQRPMKQLVAVKRMSYAKRRLEPGDTFEATPSDAKIWILLGKARPRAETLQPPPQRLVRKVIHTVADEIPPPAVVENPLALARDEYQLKLGKRPFHGWDVEELRRRISEAE